jgi:hypothetical protein
MKLICVDGMFWGELVELGPNDWTVCFAAPYGQGDLVITYHRRTYWPGVPFSFVDVLVNQPDKVDHPDRLVMKMFWAMRTLDDS